MPAEFADKALFPDDDVPRPSGISQWLALTRRIIRVMARTELPVAVVIPLIFTIGFYLPLKFVMEATGLDYAQFVMPIIVLQSMGFTAMSTAIRSATEARGGFSSRMRTMPVAAGAPLAARLTSGTIRSSISLAAAIVYGYCIGFRFSGFAQAAAFCAFALATGLVLSCGADALGSLTQSTEAVSQAITLPYLILGMLSSGFTPIDSFPDWIQPFARNQPITHFSAVLRDLAAGDAGFGVVWPALAWLCGLIVVFVPLAIWAATRRR